MNEHELADDRLVEIKGHPFEPIGGKAQHMRVVVPAGDFELPLTVNGQSVPYR